MRSKLLYRLILLSLLIPFLGYSQKVINHEIPVQGLVKLSDQVSIPKINPGYTLWLPTRVSARGMLVFMHSRRDTVQMDDLISYALQKQMAVLYVTTDNRVEFLFEIAKQKELESYLQEVIKQYQIPADKLMFCGMSLAGTRALKMAAFAKTAQSSFQIIPKAIAICDAPLDMVRFYREGEKAAQLNYQTAATNEGAWTSAYLRTRLGGTPSQALKAYEEYSPYCYTADAGGNAGYYKNIAIRAYSEPDALWWMETRRKDYYGMNTIDMAALINQLWIMGNEQAMLILTENKGYRPDGSRHPHSWSIVDERELIDWFVSLLD